MSPLESKRLLALGHSPEQVNAIREYEQTIKQEFARVVRRILVQDVPNSEYSKRSPDEIKVKIGELLRDLAK